MRVFGCAWKINFPEIIFSWPGVLKALTRKWFEVKIFTSNHFRTHTQRQKRESLRLQLYRLRQSQPSTSTSLIYEPTDLRTDHAFNFADHVFDFADFVDHTFDFADLWTHEPIFDPEPSTHEPSTSPMTKSLCAPNRSLTLRLQPKATNPRTDLSLCVIFIFCVILIDPRTHEPLISGFFLLLWWCGWWCFGGFPVM